MSNYRALAYHPTSGRLEVADWLDNLYGKRQYGVRFHSDGQRYPQHEVRVPSPVDLFLIAQEMAEALGLAEEALRADGIVMAADRARTALAKWRDFTNAKSDEDALAAFANKLAAEQEPLPADMQRVWDENRDALYENGPMRTNAKEKTDG